MQTNRRRADLLFKIDTFVEKKNCSRCYRLHKKCDGGTPSCSRCSSSKAACIYTYNAAENKLNTLDTTKVDLENNIANLQQSLEQQKQAYQILQEQFEQIKSQNFNLQNMNMYLSQALSTKVIQENQIASAAEKQSLLGTYRNNGYFYIRVTPLFDDVHKYMQEKASGRNPLKAATMDLVFGAVYTLAGKPNKGFDYMNSALSAMASNSLNSPLGLICMHMMAENLFLIGQKIQCTTWLQKIHGVFTEMEIYLNDPNKATFIHNQLATLSQIMDVNFARSVSIMWTQWVPRKVTNKQRIDQYLKQVEISHILKSSIYQNICSPCGVPVFYILKLISGIIIAIEHQIDCPSEVPFIAEQSLSADYLNLVAYSRMSSEPKMKENFTIGILVIKIFVAVLTANYTMSDQFITELMNTGHFDEEYPSPHEAIQLFIVLQLLFYVQSPYFTKAIQQYEKWTKNFPSYSKFYEKWIQTSQIEPTELLYPVPLCELEDYFVVLPHLYYMQRHSIVFTMQLPIFNEDSVSNSDVTDSLLSTPFDAAISPEEISPQTNNTEPSNNEDSVLDGTVVDSFVFTPVDFAVADYEIESIVNSL